MASEVSAALRALVRARALGRCEYCGLAESLSFVAHQIDHIISVKHSGTSDPENLALACTLCNRYKGSDIAAIDPETACLSELFHPRRNKWDEHFRHFSSGSIVALTPQGRATVRLLQLNRPDRIRERLSQE